MRGKARESGGGTISSISPQNYNISIFVGIKKNPPHNFIKPHKIFGVIIYMPTFYNQYPISISKTGSTTVSSDNFIAYDLSINYNAQASPRRYFRPSISSYDTIKSTGPLEVKLAFSFYLNELQTGSFDCLKPYFDIDNSNSSQYTGSHVIRVGGTRFSGCFLDEIVVNCDNLFKPISSSVSFSCFDSPTGLLVVNNSDSAVVSEAEDFFAYGIISPMSDPTTTSQAKQLANVHKYSFKHGLNLKRTPVYGLNSINPQYTLIDEAEKTLDLSCDDVNGLMNFSGNILNNNLLIDVKDRYENTILTIKMKEGSRILSQNISVAGGDSLKADISMREVLV
jgi:hypothetical protein